MFVQVVTTTIEIHCVAMSFIWRWTHKGMCDCMGSCAGFRKARSFKLQSNSQLASTTHSLHVKQSHRCNFEQWLHSALKYFSLFCAFVCCGLSWVEGMPVFWVRIDRTVDGCFTFMEKPCWFTWISCNEAWTLFTNVHWKAVFWFYHKTITFCVLTTVMSEDKISSVLFNTLCWLHMNTSNKWQSTEKRTSVLQLWVEMYLSIVCSVFSFHKDKPELLLHIHTVNKIKLIKKPFLLYFTLTTEGFTRKNMFDNLITHIVCLVLLHQFLFSHNNL